MVRTNAAKSRGRSRNVDNLHIITTSVSTSENARTVITVPLDNATEMKQHREVKNLVNKTSNALAKQKCSAVSFSKKKISAAKKLSSATTKQGIFKISIKKLEFSNKNSAQFDNKKNHNSYSRNILALYDVDRLNRNQSPSSLSYKITSNKKSISKQEDSSWVPMETKKNNSPKDASFEKKDALDRKRNSLSTRMFKDNEKHAVPAKYYSKTKKKMHSNKASSISLDKDEREKMQKYSSPWKHFPSRREEDKYYDKKYGLYRNSKSRRSREYERHRETHQYERQVYSSSGRRIRKESHKEIEGLEDVSDDSLGIDFEEVETASVEDSGKSEIPVGFRKYKTKHLNLKSSGFFKPKRYHICQERIIVNCLNVLENESVEVDVVSEAECDADHETAEKNSEKKVEVKHMEDNSKDVKIGDIKTKNENVETSTINNVSSTKEKTEEKLTDLASDIVKEDIQSTSDGVNMEAIISNSKPKIKKLQEVISNSKVYYSCITEADSPDFYQGFCQIQKYLDEWKSHLIGLEYVIEIRNMCNTNDVTKYYCSLCEEDILGENYEEPVINHITSYNHGSLYLAKHFPSCDYIFLKNGGSYISNIVLQKCCEEINRKFYSQLMCITTDDYFQKHANKFNEFHDIQTHWSESDINLDPAEYVKIINSNMDDEILQILTELVNKISPGEEIATFITSQNLRMKKAAKNAKKNSDMLNSNDNLSVNSSSAVVGRNLIVLTPQHGHALKCSPDLSRRNLLQVITHEDSSSSFDNSNIIVCKQNESSDLNITDMSGKEISNTDNGNASSSIFKTVNKKANSFRKYRVQPTTLQNTISESKSIKNKQSDSINTSRKVIKKGSDITVYMESNINACSKLSCDEEKNVIKPEVIVIQEDDFCIENVEQVKEESNLESESDSVTIISSTGSSGGKACASKTKGKAKHHSHQKTTLHSKHCHKRIVARSSKLIKESAIKNEPDVLDEMINESSKMSASDFERQIKNLSPVDSKSSSSSKRITSPLRIGYSPDSSRRHFRSSGRRRSRSPRRRRSRSPLKRYSPIRRRSRSPLSRLNKSPPNRRSRSPVRRYSRSPVRRRSRTPLRRYSRRHSRSPFRRYSRSPVGRRSRSPAPKYLRSPSWRRGRNIRRQSRSPYRKVSRSPVYSQNSRNASLSPPRRAPNEELRMVFEKCIKSPLRKEAKQLGQIPTRSESRNSFYKDSDNISISSREFAPIKHSYAHHMQHESERNANNLDPISDEDESVYFNTMEGIQHIEEIKKLPEPTRSIVMQLFQKLSVPKNVTRNSSLSDFMQFLHSRNSEISQLMAHPSNDPHLETGSNMTSRYDDVQQYIISEFMKTSNFGDVSQDQTFQHTPPSFHQPQLSPMPSSAFSSSTPRKPPGPPFQSSNIQQYAIPPPMPQAHSQSFDEVPVMHGRAIPHQYEALPQQSNYPYLPPRLPGEGMFKDLKATVNKLFGDKHMMPPGFMSKQNNEKWDSDHSNAPFLAHNYNSGGPNRAMGSGKDLERHPRGPMEYEDNLSVHSNMSISDPHISNERMYVPPPDTKVSFCETSRAPLQRNLFPVINNPESVPNYSPINSQINIGEAKVTLAQRLAAVLVKIGMLDVPGSLLQEMLMKIGAFSSCPPQNIDEREIIDILKKLQYI